MLLVDILFTVVVAIASIVLSDTTAQSSTDETCTDAKCQDTAKSRHDSAKYLQRPKVILYWTTYYGHRDFEFGLGQQPFKDAGCRVTNCVATDDPTRSQEADALMFHMRNVNQQMAYPKKRLPHQRYVFFLLEHPYHQWNDLRGFSGFFNLTMTYRRDSDIFMPYGKIETLSQSETDSPVVVPHKKSMSLVAWFVSNCQSHSKREEYVKELQKYIPVDVYGQCGPLQCPPNNDQYHAVRMWPDCYKMLEENYKFYISFENNFCKDYVTEKMMNILNLTVVPIVFGGTDYSRDAPPNSVINILDFDSPKQLSEYLIELDQNEEKYLEYFRWKSQFKVVTKKAFSDAFCRLCEILNDSDYPSKSHNDLDQWWGKDKYCDLAIMSKLKQKWKVK